MLRRFADVIQWALVVGLTVAVVTVIASRGPRAADEVIPVPVDRLLLKDVSLEGSPNARVALLVFSDFECPYCGVFARDVLPILRKEYVETGKVVLGFRHLPLEAIHPAAVPAAVAAECAGMQGKFWQMHDWLFAQQATLRSLNLKDPELIGGLDTQKFRQCSEEPPLTRLRSDAAAAKALGITSTPAFFLGTVEPTKGGFTVTRTLAGAWPADTYRGTLNQLLK